MVVSNILLTFVKTKPMTLIQILIFAIKHNACPAQLKSFTKFIFTFRWKSAWQTVQGNIGWLKSEGLKINPQFLWKKSGGLGKTWHRDGGLRELHSYNSEGKRIGLSQTWHENGQLTEQYTYNSKGRQEGLYQRWHQDGELDI